MSNDEKKITWSNVHTRIYDQVLIGSTMLLGIDWKYTDTEPVPIDIYEEQKNNEYGINQLSYEERRNVPASHVPDDSPLPALKCGCKCTLPNIVKLSYKAAKRLLRSWNVNNVSGTHCDLLARIARCSGTCLCRDLRCECIRDAVECFYGCECRSLCKNKPNLT